MKKIIIFLIVALIGNRLLSQEYISFSFDVNNAFELKDNPRMLEQVNGFDWDLEIGAIYDNIGVGIFYGEFKNANYKNYGVTLDYYYNPLERLYLSLGNQYHVVIRSNEQKHLGTTGSYLNPRGKISYDISFLIIEFIVEFTQRNDINKRVFEGSIGIRKNFR